MRRDEAREPGDFDIRLARLGAGDGLRLCYT
jgi:hypothetical protein